MLMKLLGISYVFKSTLGSMGKRKAEDKILPLGAYSLVGKSGCVYIPSTRNHNAQTRLWTGTACFMFVDMFQGNFGCLITNHASNSKSTK